MVPLAIRPMAEADIERVRIIDAMVYREVWSEELLRAETNRTDRLHVVGVDLVDGGERLVGHAGLLIVGDEATLTTVAVDPELQGAGVATRLLCHVFGEANLRGITALTLEVRASNIRAQRLYHRFGFAPVGVRTRYYAPAPPIVGAPATVESSRREDAVIMWAHEVDTADYEARLRAISELLEVEVGETHG